MKPGLNWNQENLKGNLESFDSILYSNISFIRIIIYFDFKNEFPDLHLSQSKIVNQKAWNEICSFVTIICFLNKLAL